MRDGRAGSGGAKLGKETAFISTVSHSGTVFDVWARQETEGTLRTLGCEPHPILSSFVPYHPPVCVALRKDEWMLRAAREQVRFDL
jgi:hypothetical protein